MALCWPLKSKLPLLWHSRARILCRPSQEVNFILNSRQDIKSNTENGWLHVEVTETGAIWGELAWN